MENKKQDEYYEIVRTEDFQVEKGYDTRKIAQVISQASKNGTIAVKLVAKDKNDWACNWSTRDGSKKLVLIVESELRYLQNNLVPETANDNNGVIYYPVSKFKKPKERTGINIKVERKENRVDLYGCKDYLGKKDIYPLLSIIADEMIKASNEGNNPVIFEVENDSIWNEFFSERGDNLIEVLEAIFPCKGYSFDYSIGTKNGMEYRLQKIRDKKDKSSQSN